MGEPILRCVVVPICEPCLRGEGEMCHSPGCSFIRRRPKDWFWSWEKGLDWWTVPEEIARLQRAEAYAHGVPEHEPGPDFPRSFPTPTPRPKEDSHG